MPSFGFNADFGFYGTDDNPLLKDAGLMEFQAGDSYESAAFNDSTNNLRNSQPNKIAPATTQSTHRAPSHRGSTSSSSSLRSTGSNSPHTSHSSMDVTAMEISPSAWKFETVGDHDDNYMMDASNDMSQFLDLSSAASSPCPPVTNEPSPDAQGPYESVPQGRAVKRRKAQQKGKMQQSSNQSTNRARAKDLRDFSPVVTQIPSNESSPAAVFTNNLPSPDGNITNYTDVFGMNMPPGWPSTSSALGNPAFSHSSCVPPGVQRLPISSPPALPPHSPMPRLVIHPMPMKSRVETQIPLKITLHNLPKGIKRVHLPTHTIAKPKLLHKPTTGRAPDMLELTTMLVCTSAMGDPRKLERAYSRAAAKLHTNELNSPSDGPEDEESKPQNGGEVRICTGCITRERKRAGRKKHKKPEEDELWDRYERERAIVFNTHEVKDWQTVTPVMADPTGAGLLNGAVPEGTVQVDAPMRIACYCRHHSEKLGFQVIITLKDYMGNLIAQQISSSIMITDDHKTHIPTHTGTTPQPQAQLQHLPQPQSQSPAPNGTPIAMSSQPSTSQPLMTHPSPLQSTSVQPPISFHPNSTDTSLPFRQTHSTSDLQSLGQSPVFPYSPGPPMNSSQVAPTNVAPRNLSRQTSPASPISMGSRKRKASIATKVPTGLAMTKIETSQPPPSMPPNVQNESAVVSAGNSPFSPSLAHFPVSGDLTMPQGSQQMLSNMPHSLGAGPATPSTNGTEPFMFPTVNRGMNIDLPVNQIRAPSPSQLRTELQNLQHSQRAQDILSGPTMPQPTILRIIPNEGPKSGGVEITVLGRNFTNDGLEVYFGSQKATTTTYWGETSLVCLLPPSPVAGVVPAIQQPSIFKYVDDNEQQLIRTALTFLATKLGGSVTDAADVARSILYGRPAAPGSGNQAPNGNGNNNFTSFNLGSPEAMIDLDDSPNKARINLRRSSGQTMLHLACSLGFVRFVAGLLSRGANVNIGDKGGFTPLHMAAMNDHPEIVRRLVVKGADRNAQSLSGLTPADVAHSRAVLRSLRHIEGHMRSRSTGSLHSRASSASSLRSLWEPSTMTPVQRQEFLDNSSQDEVTEEDPDWLDMRRASFSGSRRRSTVATHKADEVDGGPTSPSATVAAIREQVATQLQQFQHTMAMHFQNIPQFQMPNMPQMPNLPPMPILPDYQAYLHSAPVMQRISSLVPNIRGQRPESPGHQPANHTDNRWGSFPFFGNKDSPPAYEDIFPQKNVEIKQASAAQAAADFEVDAKCAVLYDQSSSEASETREIPDLLQIGRKHLITKEQQETLQRAHAQRLKTGRSDKMLWFVWIPILVLVLGAMLWSGAPSLASSTANVARTVASLVTNPRDIGNKIHHFVQELA
ncbi:hypothetical protein F5Y19DRAFT_463733 [Xylariaceae sp. FL1651]|nr:hypothetical protein F5Y19DRAFT_463733 [Xylariaceae sp. FL1651]